MTQHRLLIAMTTLGLAACSPQTPETGNTATSAPDTQVGVTRTEASAEDTGPAVQPMAAMNVIQSQPGPDGSQVDLLKVAVTGDILTVTMRCSSEERINTESFRIEDISVIDDATSQRLGVLRDNGGNALVSKFNKSSSPKYDSMSASCEQKPGVIWAKFPAPPVTSKTVSINFPEVAPFDGIPVTR